MPVTQHGHQQLKNGDIFKIIRTQVEKIHEIYIIFMSIFGCEISPEFVEGLRSLRLNEFSDYLAKEEETWNSSMRISSIFYDYSCTCQVLNHMVVFRAPCLPSRDNTPLLSQPQPSLTNDIQQQQEQGRLI